MSEFKVGDKVCDPFLGKNGLVIDILDDNTFPIRVVFEDGGNDSYTTYGCLYSHFITQSIFHGHMEPGTGKVTFTPKKEPKPDVSVLCSFTYSEELGAHFAWLSGQYKDNCNVKVTFDGETHTFKSAEVIKP